MAAAALGLMGCSGSPTADSAPVDGQTEPVTITVSAAASLQRSFDEIASAFETAHPEVDVAPIGYDGSSTLATQIIEGAPVDVFASADERNMQLVVDEGLAAGAEVFATNTLVIAVPAGNPAKVTGLADLASAVTVLCAPEVPCGAASAQLLANAGIAVTPASLEQNVTAVLQKVAAGEADAGLVYRTDVVGDDAVESITPEGADAVVNRYPIVALESTARTGPEQAAAAQAFVDFVLGAEGQAVLAAHGFGTTD
nr:molybdate ABC transporter substrate-binding protein [Leucobacter salsicius]